MDFKPVVTTRSVESLIPFARNSRTHSDAQVAQIAASMREFGFVNPILIKSDGTIIAGHGRALAARKLGLESAPVIECDHLSEHQVRALVIADNRIALSAEWDEKMLKNELADLSDDDFDLDVLGFDTSELDDLLADDTEDLDSESGGDDGKSDVPTFRLQDITLKLTEEDVSMFRHKLSVYEDETGGNYGFLRYLMTGFKPSDIPDA